MIESLWFQDLNLRRDTPKFFIVQSYVPTPAPRHYHHKTACLSQKLGVRCSLSTARTRSSKCRSGHRMRQTSDGVVSVSNPPYHPHLPEYGTSGCLTLNRILGPMMSSGPHPQVPLTQAQIAQQQQAQAQASELAKRRSRKPTDKTLPDGVEDCIVDPEAVQRYKDLRDAERRIDATMTRKRLDIMESVNRNAKTYKTLRIWINNTVEDQVWQGNGLNVDAFDFAPNLEASYRVKIQGRLLDGDDDSDAEDGDDAIAQKQNVSHEEDRKKIDEDVSSAQKDRGATGKPLKLRFSSFFKSMTVDFDASKFRNGTEQTVEWKKPDTSSRTQGTTALPAAADFDELTFKRNGDENMNITINLHRHETPERYKLSPDLAEVVDMTEATQQEAVMGLWEYIRLAGLQEDEEKRNFRCDELLKKVGTP